MPTCSVRPSLPSFPLECADASPLSIFFHCLHSLRLSKSPCPMPRRKAAPPQVKAAMHRRTLKKRRVPMTLDCPVVQNDPRDRFTSRLATLAHLGTQPFSHLEGSSRPWLGATNIGERGILQGGHQGRSRPFPVERVLGPAFTRVYSRVGRGNSNSLRGPFYGPSR